MNSMDILYRFVLELALTYFSYSISASLHVKLHKVILKVFYDLKRFILGKKSILSLSVLILICIFYCTLLWCRINSTSVYTPWATRKCL